jgi:1-acyl-sn-glycerol-3-phosphate acyltransferase
LREALEASAARRTERSLRRAGRLRAATRLLAFALGVIVGAPLQGAALLCPGRARAYLPMLFHRYACWALGLRRQVVGAPSSGGALIVANHASWMDVLVLSACAPVSFAARADMAGWPGVGWLARMQRTIFVARDRRARAGADASEIGERLAAGDDVVIFAEGTTSDGNEVLPFRSALLAAARNARRVQSATIVYAARDGDRLDAQGRADVAWHGEKELGPHVWAMLRARVIEVHVAFGPPRSPVLDRKTLAASLEAEVRARFERLAERPPSAAALERPASGAETVSSKNPAPVGR